ncbi:hypothetical protein T439DRAFT_320588, partial [Meredithblackwellia eburnea MCA 4105]
MDQTPPSYQASLLNQYPQQPVSAYQGSSGGYGRRGDAYGGYYPQTSNFSQPIHPYTNQLDPEPYQRGPPAVYAPKDYNYQSRQEDAGVCVPCCLGMMACCLVEGLCL